MCACVPVVCVCVDACVHVCVCIPSCASAYISIVRPADSGDCLVVVVTKDTVVTVWEINNNDAGNGIYVDDPVLCRDALEGVSDEKLCVCMTFTNICVSSQNIVLMWQGRALREGG